MALPIQNAVTYSLKIPSTGQQIQYRPFLIKDEKNLLIAQQSEDPKVMVDSLKEVIKNCVKDDIDIHALATFDIEYMFTQIRAKSVGEQVDLHMKCDKCVDDEKAITKVSIDITQLEVDIPENHNNKINLFDDVGIVMKYPSFDIIGDLSNLDENNVDQMFDLVIKCIDSIYNSTEIFHAKEQTRDEMIEFLNNLSSEQFGKIQSFFESMPKLSKTIEYDCPVCQTHHKKVIEGMQNFF